MSDLLKLTKLQWHIFIGSFIAVFLMVVALHLGITPAFLITPVPEPRAMDSIHPKLAEKTNTFSLKKNLQFIPLAHAGSPYESAAAYAVVDLSDGSVIKEKNLSQKMPIASLTKIMTAIVALDLMKTDERITISKRATKQIPTKIGVVAGEHMTLHELLQATMLTSANDAAQAISDYVDTMYKEPIFVRAMNEKASILQLKSTHFTNPQGFDNREHYSSVEDLAIVTQYAMTHYPEFRKIVKEPYAFLPENSDHKQFDLYNWNGLLGVYPNVSGVKIGNTDDAGKTTLVISEREGTTLMVILLGAPGILERDLWSAQLLDEAFKDTRGLEPIGITDEALREKYATWKY